jgi:SAM-dependent methyltransferase
MTKTTVDHGPGEHWERFSRNYYLNVPPIRPSLEDLAYCWGIANEWIQKRGVPRVLLLGVTPGLYHLPWPKRTDLLAVDHTQAMIDAMWPGSKEAVLRADWVSMDLPKGSRDIVLCDGGLHLLDYPKGQHTLIRLLHRILSEEGLCIFRLFVLPSQRETPDVVIRDLLDGKISNLSILKLRLFMSMHEDAEDGVELGQVYDALIKAAPDLEALAVKIGWSKEHMLVINNYRGLKSIFHLLTLEQTIDLFCGDPGGFRVQRVLTPAYEPVRRCPTVALRRCSLEEAGEEAVCRIQAADRLPGPPALDSASHEHVRDDPCQQGRCRP